MAGMLHIILCEAQGWDETFETMRLNCVRLEKEKYRAERVNKELLQRIEMLEGSVSHDAEEVGSEEHEVDEPPEVKPEGGDEN